jgi:hypothetical protein
VNLYSPWSSVTVDRVLPLCCGQIQTCSSQSLAWSTATTYTDCSLQGTSCAVVLCVAAAESMSVRSRTILMVLCDAVPGRSLEASRTLFLDSIFIFAPLYLRPLRRASRHCLSCPAQRQCLRRRGRRQMRSTELVCCSFSSSAPFFCSVIFGGSQGPFLRLAKLCANLPGQRACQGLRGCLVSLIASKSVERGVACRLCRLSTND